MDCEIIGLRSGVFFKRIDGRLMQRHRLTLRLAGPAEREAEFTGPEWRSAVPLGAVPGGISEHEVYLPDYREECVIEVACGGSRKRFEMKPRRHWELHAVPITHHDMGYTKSMEDVVSDYDRYYDDILALLDGTSHYPDDAKYRYTAECSMTFLHYLERRPGDVLERYLRYIRDGRMEVSAFYCNLIDGNAGREEMVRLLYPSFSLKRKYGIPVETASIVDIPGLSAAIPAVLAGAGIRYFFAGMPDYFSWNKPGYPFPASGFWDERAVLGPAGRPAAFRWQAPDGSNVLVYYQGGYGAGLRGYRDTYADIAEKVEKKLAELEENGMPFPVARFIDFGGDNQPPRGGISELAARWNREFEFPRFIVSTNAGFFRALEKHCGGVTTMRGELPHTDYTVCSYGAAAETSLSRRTHERLTNLEALSAAVCMASRSDAGTESVMGIYKDLMTYDEHCFGMYIPMGLAQDWSWNTKRGHVLRAAARTENLYADRLRDLAEALDIGREGLYVTVFNPLSYARSDVVRIENFAWYGREFRLTDSRTGKAVPFQIEKVDRPGRARPYAGFRYALGIQDALVVTKDRVQPDREFLYDLVFVAEDIPPLGYAAFYLEPGQPDTAQSGVRVLEGCHGLENRFYRVEVDGESGAVRSILDKKNALELVDPASEHGFNQMVLRQLDAGETMLSAASGVRLASQGPVSSTLAVTAACGRGVKLIQEITLYGELDRIDISNRIIKDGTPLQEAYFAFPFALDAPRFSLETAGMPEMRPFEDQMPGSNTNYYSALHWALVRNGRAAAALAPVDANIVEFGGLWPCHVSQGHHGLPQPGFTEPFVSRERMHRKGHVYSFVMNNNYRTNFSSVQPADCLFRYVIRTWKAGDCRIGDVRRFGWAAANPLAAHACEGPAYGHLGAAGSFCALSGGDVLAQALKKAEDGRGYILRVCEMGGVESEVRVEVPHLVLSRVERTDAAEFDTGECIGCEPHGFRFTIKPYETAAFRLQSGYIDDAGYGFYRDNGEFQRGLYGR